MNIKQTIKDLKIKFPDVEVINIEYRGSGDSFEDFWNLESVPTSNIQQEDIEDLLWHIIDNSDANFNNEGSEGTIQIDLKNEKASIDNYYIVYDREASGERVFE